MLLVKRQQARIRPSSDSEIAYLWINPLLLSSTILALSLAVAEWRPILGSPAYIHAQLHMHHTRERQTIFETVDSRYLRVLNLHERAT